VSKYTNDLTAEQLIYFIANDCVELSHDKIVWQRDDHMKICREWLLHNIMNNIEPDTSVEIYVKDDF